MAGKEKKDDQVMYMPLGMCIGMSLGLALGSAMGHIGTGMCLGLGIGMCFGVAMDASKKKAKQDGTEKKENEEK